MPDSQTPPDWRKKVDDEKLMLFLARFPSAEALGRFIDEHEKLVEDANRRTWVFSFIKNVALWMTAVAGGLAVLKGYLSDIGGKP